MPTGFGKFTHLILDEEGDPIAAVAYVEQLPSVLIGAVWFFDQYDTELTTMDLGEFELLPIMAADPKVRAQAAFQLLNRVPA